MRCGDIEWFIVLCNETNINSNVMICKHDRVRNSICSQGAFGGETFATFRWTIDTFMAIIYSNVLNALIYECKQKHQTAKNIIKSLLSVWRYNLVELHIGLDPISKTSFIWVLPKIVVPQNGWFIWKTLLKLMISGHHYFWKHPYLNQTIYSTHA